MVRSIAIVSAITLLAAPATAFALTISPAASIYRDMVEVRLSKSNACKLKYKYRKAAQDLREKAHCK